MTTKADRAGRIRQAVYFNINFNIHTQFNIHIHLILFKVLPRFLSNLLSIV